MKKLGLLATVIAAIAFPAPPALAFDDFVVAIRLDKPSEDFFPVDSPVIEFTSNFVAEIDLAEIDEDGDHITDVLIPVSWTVVAAGPATFNKVGLKKGGFTKGVVGSVIAVALTAVQEPFLSVCPGMLIAGFPVGVEGDLFNVACFALRFESLRCSGGSKLTAKGKVHVKLTLNVTIDGKTKPIGLGINLKLRDPDGCP